MTNVRNTVFICIKRSKQCDMCFQVSELVITVPDIGSGREGGALWRQSIVSLRQCWSAMTSGGEGSQPQTPILTVGCRMLRSPSHESVTTDLSLFSVSSIASEAANRSNRLVSFKPYSDMAGRGPSPCKEQVR